MRRRGQVHGSEILSGSMGVTLMTYFGATAVDLKAEGGARTWLTLGAPHEVLVAALRRSWGTSRPRGHRRHS